jgi:hypothetical protein
MDSDSISEEDKAGVLRLGAHDANTIEGRFEVMNYEVTTAAATDLYARTGRDTSKIRDYVGKVSIIFIMTCTLLSKETDSSQLVDTDISCLGPYGHRS